jgi:hypothetical protein
MYGSPDAGVTKCSCSSTSQVASSPFVDVISTSQAKLVPQLAVTILSVLTSELIVAL